MQTGKIDQKVMNHNEIDKEKKTINKIEPEERRNIILVFCVNMYDHKIITLERLNFQVLKVAECVI